MSKAFVINTGIITNLGVDTASNFNALIDKKEAIGLPQIFHTYWKNTFPVGEILCDNATLMQRAGISELWPRTALLSAHAVREALCGYEFLVDAYRVGFFSANTVGGMDHTEDQYQFIVDGINDETYKYYRFHECGIVSKVVAQNFGIKDFVTTISTACSSSANSIMLAAQMIEDGKLDIAIAGGADALSKFTLNGFNTLMILDKALCQPFDQNRRGLNLGEGAAYLLLVSERVLKAHNLSAMAYINGFGNANDAHHQTASSPEGKGNQLAMKQALATANIQPKAIDFINAHGTGTPNNDSSELAAIQQLFQDDVPPYSSTKSYTGHTLGASGAVEAVFSVLSLQHQTMFPTLRWTTPMEDFKLWKPVTEVISDRPLQHILSNSFGFGGNCSSLIISKA